VEDSPNSAGSAIDAIRVCKLALDREIGGPLNEISAYTMKHPPVQYTDDVARRMVEAFINEREMLNESSGLGSWEREAVTTV